jgi:hypothetical protein
MNEHESFYDGLECEEKKGFDAWQARLLHVLRHQAHNAYCQNTINLGFEFKDEDWFRQLNVPELWTMLFPELAPVRGEGDIKEYPLTIAGYDAMSMGFQLPAGGWENGILPLRIATFETLRKRYDSASGESARRAETYMQKVLDTPEARKREVPITLAGLINAVKDRTLYLDRDIDENARIAESFIVYDNFRTNIFSAYCSLVGLSPLNPLAEIKTSTGRIPIVEGEFNLPLNLPAMRRYNDEILRARRLI